MAQKLFIRKTWYEEDNHHHDCCVAALSNLSCTFTNTEAMGSDVTEWWAMNSAYTPFCDGLGWIVLHIILF